MTKATRKKYTLEFKQEAARLVESGQSQAAAARSLGVAEQTRADGFASIAPGR
jgi:transposase